MAHDDIWLWDVSYTTVNPCGLDLNKLPPQEELLLQWWQKSPTTNPRWIVGEGIPGTRNVKYAELPVLPVKYASSIDPLGRPFVYVSMFDPTGLTCKAAAGAARRAYAVLVQTPRHLECVWRFPPQVLVFKHNKYKSRRRRRCASTWTQESVQLTSGRDRHFMTQYVHVVTHQTKRMT